MTKLSDFYRGSQQDHFDTMVQDISQVTQLQPNLVMTDEKFQAPVSSLFADWVHSKEVKMTTMWVTQPGFACNNEDDVSIFLRSSISNDDVQEAIVLVPMGSNQTLVFFVSSFNLQVKCN